MPDDNDNNEISFASDPDEESKSSSDCQTPVKTTADIKMPLWLKVFVFAGLLCIGQFFVCSLIGLFRGYSVQSRLPHIILLAGIFILLAPSVRMISMGKEKYGQRSLISYLISFSIIYISIIGMLQGRFNDIGDDLSDQGEYSAAIVYYEKELSTWYLRLNYNHRESQSLREIDECLFRMAQDHCKEADFDKARQVYRQVVVRNDKIEYSKYYLERSAAEVEELDRELANIAVMQDHLAAEVEDNKKAMILFDIALAYRRIECIKKAKEQYEIIQTLDVYEVFIENAKKFSAGLDGS